MKQSKYTINTVLVFATLFFMICAFFVSKSFEKPPIFITKQQSSFNLDQKILDFFHLGQKRLFSSLFWIATILESDHDHYKARDLNSWMYLRFLTISQLEPKFLYNYIFGGIYLSIIKDDLNGASDIYNRGLDLFPNDFKLLQDAGYHFYFEVGDLKHALPIYEKLRFHPKSSPLMISTLARMKSSGGDLQDAFHLLYEKYDKITDKDSLPAKKIWEHLYAIKAEMDLKCLNEKGAIESCPSHDLDGQPYVKSDKKIYISKKAWTKFTIKIKKSYNP